MLDITINLYQYEIICRVISLLTNPSNYQLQFNFVELVRVIEDVASVLPLDMLVLCDVCAQTGSAAGAGRRRGRRQ